MPGWTSNRAYSLPSRRSPVMVSVQTPRPQLCITVHTVWPVVSLLTWSLTTLGRYVVGMTARYLPLGANPAVYAGPKLFLGDAQLVAQYPLPQVNAVRIPFTDRVRDFRPEDLTVSKCQFVSNMIVVLTPTTRAVRNANPTICLAKLLVILARGNRPASHRPASSTSRGAHRQTSSALGRRWERSPHGWAQNVDG